MEAKGVGSLKERFLGSTIGSAMYARFIVSHYHTFARVDGGLEHRIRLPDRDLDGEFLADPFLFAWRERVWLFFEGMYKGRGDRGVAKGGIGCLCYDNGDWVYQGVVLEEPYHLSYPQVFEDEGVVYMIPETAQAGEIALYEAVDFPMTWRKKAVLIRGKYVDSSIFHKGGEYYIVTTPDDRQSRSELWCATALAGPWGKHPASDNVSSSPALRRNGGAIYEEAGHVYRIAQDCDGGYGKRLYRVPVLEVSTDSYSEGTPDLLSDAISWPQQGMHHTYNRILVDDALFEVVDRHYNTIREPISFLSAVMWYLIDGVRHVFRLVSGFFQFKTREMQ